MSVTLRHEFAPILKNCLVWHSQPIRNILYCVMNIFVTDADNTIKVSLLMLGSSNSHFPTPFQNGMSSNSDDVVNSSLSNIGVGIDAAS